MMLKKKKRVKKFENIIEFLTKNVGGSEWNIKLGPATFNEKDFRPYKAVIVNDITLCEVCLEDIDDAHVLKKIKKKKEQ